MAKLIKIHPENPQLRLIRQVVEMIDAGAVMAFPTDSSYALGCCLGDKEAQMRIRQIRQLDKRHNFTLICRDLSELGIYAQVSNRAYRLLKAHTPGPYTYILAASREVPKRLQNPKRKTIGLRVPKNKIIQTLLAEFEQPLLSVTLSMPGEIQPLTNANDILDVLDKQVDLIIDGGHCGVEPTTVVDLQEISPKILRVGRGDPGPFQV